MDVVLAHPKGWELPDWVIAQARGNAEKYGGTVTVTDDEEAAYRGHDHYFPGGDFFQHAKVGFDNAPESVLEKVD